MVLRVVVGFSGHVRPPSWLFAAGRFDVSGAEVPPTTPPASVYPGFETCAEITAGAVEHDQGPNPRSQGETSLPNRPLPHGRRWRRDLSGTGSLHKVELAKCRAGQPA